MNRSRTRIWREALRKLSRGDNPPATFTAADVAKTMGLSKAGASQLLGRLSRYGSVRRVGFEPAPAGVGRQLIVYTITKKGLRDAEYQP